MCIVHTPISSDQRVPIHGLSSYDQTGVWKQILKKIITELQCHPKSISALNNDQFKICSVLFFHLEVACFIGYF